MSSVPRWNGFDVEDLYRPFIEHLESKGFQYLSCGSFRETYVRGNVVIKVPQCTDGMLDNRTEAKAYKTYKNGPTSTGIYLAPCRLLPNGSLMMVLVDKETADDEGNFPDYFPEWIEQIDGCQVGLYKRRVVAFDYALDLPERFGWEREWNEQSEYFNTEEWAYRSPNIRSFLEEQELEETG